MVLLGLPLHVLIGAGVEDPEGDIEVLTSGPIVARQPPRPPAHLDPVVAQRDLLAVDALVGVLSQEQVIRAGLHQRPQQLQVSGREVLRLIDEHVPERSGRAEGCLVVEPGGGQRELFVKGGHAQVGAAVPVALHRLPHGGPLGPVQGHAPPWSAHAQVLFENRHALG